MAVQGRHRSAWFVAVAATAAAVIALISYVIAKYMLGRDLHLLPTVTTAVVIGAFITLILARPRHPITTFKVENEEEE